MNAPNRNTLWARVVVDEWARQGLRAACVAPGSRSTPLALAFAEHGAIRVYPHVDERSAAFFALGMALESGTPVALLCTSGTAAANFYPAVVEAHQAQVPLLVLTADRPHELRESGANQTIDQTKMYGDHVRWFVDVAPPEANPPALALRALRTLAGRALAMASGSPAGPVHLNFPFRKPLEPVFVAGDVSDLPPEEAAAAMYGRPGGLPFTHFTRGVLAPSAEQVELLLEAIRNGPRGLIVCGPRSPGKGFPSTVMQLARAAGYPVLADTLSGVRFGPQMEQAPDLLLGGYSTFLHSERVRSWDPPDVILRFGTMPLSRALETYLERHGTTRQILIDESGVWQDALHTASEFVQADPESSCRRLGELLEGTAGAERDWKWIATWQEAERASWAAIEARDDALLEGGVVADTVSLLPPSARLFVASSLPVRHLDQFASPRTAPLQVFANRGASGIDGTISSALGAAAASEHPLCLVTGDLAFYHDLNGLLALKQCNVKATIVLLNNDGGGIFHRLPIAAYDPPFTELFAMPHGLDFEPVVRMYGAVFQRVNRREDFTDAFREALRADTTHVIEVRTDRVRTQQEQQEIMSAVAQRLAYR